MQKRKCLKVFSVEEKPGGGRQILSVVKEMFPFFSLQYSIYVAFYDPGLKMVRSRVLSGTDAFPTQERACQYITGAFGRVVELSREDLQQQYPWMSDSFILPSMAA